MTSADGGPIHDQHATGLSWRGRWRYGADARLTLVLRDIHPQTLLWSVRVPPNILQLLSFPVSDVAVADGEHHDCVQYGAHRRRRSTVPDLLSSTCPLPAHPMSESTMYSGLVDRGGIQEGSSGG